MDRGVPLLLRGAGRGLLERREGLPAARTDGRAAQPTAWCRGEGAAPSTRGKRRPSRKRRGALDEVVGPTCHRVGEKRGELNMEREF